MLGITQFLPPLAELFRLAPAPAAWMGFAVLLPVSMAWGIRLARGARWQAPSRL
jgi:hypothetical protein